MTVETPEKSDEYQSADVLLPLVYQQLCRFARSRAARFGAGETFTPTELVHEAYLRVAGDKAVQFAGRRHFVFAVSRAMRDLMVENLRRQGSWKRGGGYQHVDIESVALAIDRRGDEILDLSLALQSLACESPGCARVVLLSYFGGLTHEEIAGVLGLSRPTIERRWREARAWLHKKLSASSPEGILRRFSALEEEQRAISPNSRFKK